MPYTWGNDPPPIFETSCLEELNALHNEFGAELMKAKRPKTIAANLWDRETILVRVFGMDLVSAAQDAYDLIHEDDADQEELRYSDSIFCAYHPLERVAGLMMWTANKDERAGIVKGPIMLPGRGSEGALLIEHAVNLSEQAGFEGRVICRDHRNMRGRVIDPGKTRDKWVKVVDGKWRSVDCLLQQASVRRLEREIGDGSLHPSIRRSLLGPKA